MLNEWVDFIAFYLVFEFDKWVMCQLVFFLSLSLVGGFLALAINFTDVHKIGLWKNSIQQAAHGAPLKYSQSIMAYVKRQHEQKKYEIYFWIYNFGFTFYTDAFCI